MIEQWRRWIDSISLVAPREHLVSERLKTYLVHGAGKGRQFSG